MFSLRKQQHDTRNKQQEWRSSTIFWIMLQCNTLLPDHQDRSEKYSKSSSKCRGAYSKHLIFCDAYSRAAFISKLNEKYESETKNSLYRCNKRQSFY